jgi:hypothetical protein
VLLKIFPVFLNGNLRLFFFPVFNEIQNGIFELWKYTSHYIATFKRPSVAEVILNKLSRSLAFLLFCFDIPLVVFFEIISHWFYIGLIFSYTGFNKEICSVKENTHVFGFNCFWTVLLCLWILGVIELLCKENYCWNVFPISCCFLLLLET